VALIVTDDERVQLNSLAHRSRTAPHVARRARIILACAEGIDNKVVAKRLQMSQVTVCKWRGRFVRERLDGCTMSRDRAHRARSVMKRSNA
jgi:transposase